MNEDDAAVELRVWGFMADRMIYRGRPGWFVGLGSHGGSAPTLRKAIKRCLRCCGIGKWWRLGDQRASEVARRIAAEFLGGWGSFRREGTDGGRPDGDQCGSQDRTEDQDQAPGN